MATENATKDNSMKTQKDSADSCELNLTAKIGIIRYRKVWEIVKDLAPAHPFK